MLAHAASQMRTCPWTSPAFMVVRDMKKAAVWRPGFLAGNDVLEGRRTPAR